MNRARWISDLSVALEEAERLLFLLEADGNYAAETVRIRQKVQAVRSELELLNRVIVDGERVVEGAWPETSATPARR